jgi:hypothetical protein
VSLTIDEPRSWAYRQREDTLDLAGKLKGARFLETGGTALTSVLETGRTVPLDCTDFGEKLITESQVRCGTELAPAETTASNGGSTRKSRNLNTAEARMHARALLRAQRESCQQ